MLTVNWTPMVCVCAPVAVSAMLPFKVVAEVRPLSFVMSTETEMELLFEIVTLAALALPFTCSQFPEPPVEEGVAVTDSPFVPVIPTGCDAGAEVAICQAKLSEVVEGVIVGAVTVTVTGTTCDVAPVAEIVTDPWKVPAAVNAEVLSEALTVPGVVPVVVSICSHPDGPLETLEAALNVIPDGDDVIEIGCLAGAGLPI